MKMKRVSDLVNKMDQLVLMSLREEYFEKMLSGEKGFEYRKSFRKTPTKCFIYISKTRKAISGLVEFGQPIFGSANEICEIAEKDEPGSFLGMKAYLGKGKGVAIPIKKVYEFSPVSLEELKSKINRFTVPQSYYMLDQKPEIVDLLVDKPVVNSYSRDGL